MPARRPWVAAVFLVVGIAMLGGAVFAYYWSIERPRSWPHTEAIVVSSRVINPGGPSRYSPEITLRLADGSATRDVRLTPSWSSSSYRIVQAHLERFPAGQPIEVAVNPANPADVRYDLTLSWANLIVPGALGLMGLLFTGVWYFAGGEAPPIHPAQHMRPPRWFGRLFAAIGVVLMVIGGFVARSDLATLRSWPEVEGRVVDSKLVSTGTSSNRRPGSQPMFDTFVTFRYVIDGATFENGTTYGVGRDRPGAERRLRNYPAGSTHAIWYRPGDPQIIRFDMGNRLVVFAMPGALFLMGLVFAGFGLFFSRAQ